MEKLMTASGVIAIAALVAIIAAWPVQLLWNSCLVPAVESVHPIGFWQALGITVLFNILFKPTTSKTND